MSKFVELNESASNCAIKLLGSEIHRQLNNKVLKLKIVETEAYDQADAASHSYRGKTARTEVMFGPSGRLYVYFTYGLHYCCNIVVGEEGYGAAVLLRAIEPLNNINELKKNRHQLVNYNLTNGPAKLAQALKIDRTFNGHNLSKWPIKLIINDPLPINQVMKTKRIGISREKNRMFRFYIKNNPYVSKK